MKELTKDLPKPLLAVNKIPLIYYALFQAWKQDAEGAVINVHFQGDKILKALEKFSLFPIVFSNEKKEILGTAGGIRTGLEKAGWMGETIGIINPDFLYFPSPDFKLPNHLDESSDCLLYLLSQPTSSGYTGLSLNKGSVSFEKGNLFYVGISVLNSSILQEVKPETFADLSHNFRDLAQKKRLSGVLFPGIALDLGEKEYYISLKDQDFLKELGPKWEEFLDLCFIP